MNNKKDNFIVTFLFHALGDTIGFKNSDWKMDYDKPGDINLINEMVYEFIDLGGINGINISDWIISSDTFYHMAIGNTLLSFNKNIDDKFIDKGKNNLVIAYNKMLLDKSNRIFRYEGLTTKKYLQTFISGTDARYLPYDPNSGGNGCAGRSLCIGLAFHKIEDLDKLIDSSINLSKITHNSPLGFLAGFTVALFVSLAIREIATEKWPRYLIELLESEKITKYIDNDKKNSDIQFDFMDYIRYWKKYIDTRFSDDKPIKSRSTSNLIFRIKYYYENFVKDGKSSAIALSGICAVIMAYDALLDCDGKWEKIIFYAILNPSDSSTVGAIAGGFYGAVYGFGDVPLTMLQNIEEGNNLIDLGKKMYKKFY
jgi:ADP-ribosylglycohydrolase